MKTLVLTFILSLFAVTASAATVVYDSANTLAEVQGYTATLFVNGTAFPLTQTCVASTANVTCTAPLPNITSALTASGPQTFTVQFADPVLGVTATSAPFIRTRPAAPTSGRFQ